MIQPDTFFAVLNPAAGAGRCGKLAGPALNELRRAGIAIEVAETRHSGDGIALARQAYQAGYRRFLAVGGDGTSYEIINGLFPEALNGEPPTLGFLPLGTGNSFLRDFSDRGAAYATESLLAGKRRPCDVLQLTYRGGTLYYINLLSIGFPADVATLTNRSFKPLGPAGYLLGILVSLLRLRRRAFPLRTDGDAQMDQRRCLFLTFNNSQFTGGTMHIAPQANSGDGLIELVRWGPISRIGLLANLHRLYDGSHVHHPLAERRAVRRVEFALDAPIDMMVDGEVITAQCERIEVLPAALNVIA
ncbi:MAG: YegS/Rv2252/BmrU family lipid kinase [Acidobacteria bacterium]|nr:YegS/Rv2252/BmrU family lipid kinase [Acidobacteriota bacterium]